MKFQWKALAGSLALSLGTGFLSTLLTPAIQEDYAQLYRPPLAPPGWVFPVVWTVLYVLMGIAAFLVYVSDAPDKTQILRAYVIQLVFNLLWPVIFFRLDAYLPAFLWLIILWFMVFELRKRFADVDELAGKLMVPYLLWLTFAAYLSFSVALWSLS